MHGARHRVRTVLPVGTGFTQTIRCSVTSWSGSTPTELGRTPAQVALAWTLSVAPNVLLIPGTSSVAHLEENLAVAAIELDDDARERLNAVAA